MSNRCFTNQPLVTESMGAELGVGSKIVPKEDELLATVTELRRSIVPPDQYGYKQVAEYRNRFTAYCILMCMHATASRPVNDPFARFGDLDLEEGFVIVNDKVALEAHKNRFCFLPAMVVTQLRNYIADTHWLASFFLDEGRRDLAHLVTTSVSPDCFQALPLFFFLDDGLRPYQVTESSLADVLTGCWVDKPNVQRHLLETELWQRGVAPWLIDALEGHCLDGLHAFGAYGEASYMQTRSNMTEEVEACLSTWGFAPVDGLVLDRDKAPVSVKAVLDRKWSFGVDERTKDRDRRRRKLKSYLVAAIKNAVPELKQSLTHELSKIESDMPDLPAQIVSELLDEGVEPAKIFALKTKKIKVPIPSESPPISDDWGQGYRCARAAKLSFYEKGKSATAGRRASRHYAWAEFCVSAVVHGLVRPEWALALVESNPDEVIRNGQTVFFDLWVDTLRSNPLSWDGAKSPDWRWLPDHYSRGLLHGVFARQRNYVSSGRASAHSSAALDLGLVKFWFSKILSGLGVSIGKEFRRTVKAACDYFSPYWRVRWPTFLYRVMRGGIEVTPLPTSAVHRLLDSGYVRESWRESADRLSKVDLDCTRSLLPDPTTGNSAREKGARGGGNKSSVQFSYRKLDKWIDEKVPKSVRSANQKRNRKVHKSIKRLLSDPGHVFPPNIYLVLSFLSKLSLEGTDNKNVLAFSTLNGYSKTALAVIRIFDIEQDLTSLDPDSIEELFINGVKAMNRKDPNWVIDRLRSFYEFVRRYHGAPKIDWSIVYEEAGGEYEGCADAQYLTENEYHRVRSKLLLGKDSEEKLLLRGLLLFGYRFGLRVGEALFLEQQDLQVLDSSTVIVQIRKSKTFSGTRQVALTETLSDGEFEDIGLLRNRIRDENLSHLRRRIFSSTDGESNSSFLRGEIGRLLRWVTGDPGFRFHHLRHSWVTRNVMLLYRGIGRGPAVRSLIEAFSNQGYLATFDDEVFHNMGFDAVSTMVGHASFIGSTLRSYTHCCEFLVHAYCAEDEASVRDSSHLSSVLGISDVASKKRRKHLGGASVPFQRVLEEVKEFPGISSFHGGQTAWPPYDGLILDPGSLSLVDVDRLLRAYLARRRDLSGIGAVIGIPQEDCEALLVSAEQIEAESGYDLYGLRKESLLTPCLSKPSLKAISADPGGLRQNLARIDKNYSKIQRENARQVDSSLAIWCQCFKRYRKKDIWYFSSRQQGKVLIDLLKVLGIGHEQLVCQVPYLPGEKAFTECGRLLEAWGIHTPLRLSEQKLGSHLDEKSKEFRVGMSFLRNEGRGKLAFGQANRIIYLMAVHNLYRNNSHNKRQYHSTAVR